MKKQNNLTEIEKRLEKIIPRHSGQLEQTLDAFGITCRVDEINIKDNSVKYSVSIARGTRFGDIVDLEADIALAMSAEKDGVKVNRDSGSSLVNIFIKYDVDKLKQGKYEVFVDKKLINDNLNVKIENRKSILSYLSLAFFFIMPARIGVMLYTSLLETGKLGDSVAAMFIFVYLLSPAFFIAYLIYKRYW